MWHQPKQSAKKKANQQKLPCICAVWVWSKLAENRSSYPRSQHPGFPSFFSKWVAQSWWKKSHFTLAYMFKTLKTQNPGTTVHSKHQQTSTNNNISQIQPVNQSVQSINESVFVQASGDLEDCWKQAHLPSAMIAPTAGATSLGSSMTQWKWRPNPNLSIKAQI